MEIDVREDSGDKPDVIRFGDSDYDTVYYDKLFPRSFVIGSIDRNENHVYLNKNNIPNLIKALKKYQELYGEDY